MLLAPTGAGKTLTALSPFVAARLNGERWVDRLIYALPLRTLVNSIGEEAKKALLPLGFKVTFQTGTQPEDPLFDKGDVIFTTIDQVLSAYIGQPYSESRGKWNMVAGAFLGALVVFDEFHLMDIHGSLATTVDLARRLSGITQLLLMTATCPRAVSEKLAKRSQSTLVIPSEDELAAIPSQANRSRYIHVHDAPLTAEAVLNHHRSRTLVVVNTVDKAQSLYAELKELAGDIGLRLLHSRFLAADRARKEAELSQLFGPGASGQGIVVATQVVEAGLDVSFDTLHTEIAPANSIIQRMGRCARYRGERGDVHVYQLEVNESGRPRYGPYLDVREEVDETFAVLKTWDGKRLDYTAECEIVDRVHTESGLNLLASAQPVEWSAKVCRALKDRAFGAVRELVRDVWSISFILTRYPEGLLDPYRLERFSVSYVVMKGFLSGLDLKGKDLGTVWYQNEPDEEQSFDDGIVWHPVTDTDTALTQLFLAVSPRVAAYDDELGLVLGVPGDYESQPDSSRLREARNWNYSRESYGEHVQRCLAVFRQRIRQCEAAIQRLSARLGIHPWGLRLLLEMIVALHDVAKLDKIWQEKIWAWQRYKAGPGAQEDCFLAHADYSFVTDRDVVRESRFRKPPHAAEGAAAGSEILDELMKVVCQTVGDSLDDLYCALLAAIAHHHGGRGMPRRLMLSEAARTVVISTLIEALDGFEFPEEIASDPAMQAKLARVTRRLHLVSGLDSAEAEEFRTRLIEVSSGDSGSGVSSGDLGLAAYWLASRYLRLADQEAAALLNQSGKEGRAWE